MVKAAGTLELYSHYKDRTSEPIDYDTFKSIICDFNQMVMEEIIYEGGTFYMGHGLSSISVIRVKRKSKAVRNCAGSINWKETKAKKQEILDRGDSVFSEDSPTGEKYFVYFTQDTHVRFKWYKNSSSVLNAKAYTFVATRGAKGNKDKLKTFLNQNPKAHLRYPLS